MASPDITIRPATRADREQWEALWQGYLRFYESKLPDDTTATLWQRILDPAHHIECRLAATADGELVGLVHYFPHTHTWHRNPVCYLNDLFVSPEIRGGGVGEALILAVVDAAKQQGWDDVYWLTQQHNSVARGLYDKITGGSAGFVNYSIKLS